MGSNPTPSAMCPFTQIRARSHTFKGRCNVSLVSDILTLVLRQIKISKQVFRDRLRASKPRLLFWW